LSTTAPSVPPYVFEQKGTFPAPYTFDVPASLENRPDTATAKFDGTGASGPFLACLTFYGSDGERLCRMFNPAILQPGDVAEVTYIPPFGSSASQAPGTDDIRYDTDNEGGYLDVTANGPDDPSGWAFRWVNTDNGGFLVDQTGTASMFQVNAGSDGITMRDLTNGDVFECGGTAGILLSDTSGNGINETTTGTATFTGAETQIGQSGGKVGFFGTNAVTQPAHPVTLADVIAALQALGLTA